MRVAADQERRMRLLHRARENPIAARFIAGAFERELIGSPRGLHRGNVLIDQLVAPLEVDAERVVLALHVARADAKRHAPA